MATVNVVTKEVEVEVKVKKVVNTPDSVTLTLSLEEAVFLRNIVGFSSGPTDSAEEYSYAIFRALEDAKVPCLDGSLSRETLKFRQDGGKESVESAVKKWKGI